MPTQMAGTVIENPLAIIKLLSKFWFFGLSPKRFWLRFKESTPGNVRGFFFYTTRTKLKSKKELVSNESVIQ